jgi:hypothetical protein
VSGEGSDFFGILLFLGLLSLKVESYIKIFPW